MAQQVNGYQKLLANKYDTYDHWRDFCLTHGINADFLFNNQCVDPPKLLWYQYGLSLVTGNNFAYGIWTVKRNQNAKFPFIKVGDDYLSAMIRKTLIKRGDCIVFAPSNLNYSGHIAFADEDYNGTDELKCVGQNQGQGSSYGTPSNVATLNLIGFLGAFRNTSWSTIPPSPTPTYKRDNFPFVLYARKFRNPNLS